MQLTGSLVLLAQLVSSHHGASTAAAPAAGGLTWTVPKGWTAAPSPSAMRVATYLAPAATGDAEGAEVAVFFFGTGQGGSIESNVARWQGQLAPEGGGVAPKPVKKKFAGFDVTLVRADGTYASGMPGGATTPKKGWALYGAIAEGPQGNVFFKLVGPKKTVAKASPELDALLSSLKKAP